MSKVYTSTIIYSRPDRLDISRKSGFIVFAPSWKILGPALELRRSGLETEDTWKQYVKDYTQEMRESYTQYKQYWNMLCEKVIVTLCCYCNLNRYPKHCHRLVLADILTKFGFTYEGER